MNIKKVGLTALAASLVSVSAHAGAVSVAGGASMNMEGHTGEGLNAGTTFSMSNQLTFTGSGELDNGLNVSISFVLDQGDNANTTAGLAEAPFDSHSVTVSSDSLGSLTLAGEGGNSATTRIDTTAAGDLWDNFDQLSNSAGITFADAATGEGGRANNLLYASPDLGMGVTVYASYEPQGSTAASASSYGLGYTGVEGLSLDYAVTDIETGTANTSGENTAMKASYAYGPVTVTYSNMDHDEGLSTGANDKEISSVAISYTVSDELSLTYGQEESDTGTAGDQTLETSGITVAYTAGGMTITGKMVEIENGDYSTNSAADAEYWALGASFAF
jgi:outer membrane protein OmpU